MLKETLKILVWKIFVENFYVKKKQLIVLTIFILFFIFHKSDIKTENLLN